MSRPSSSLSSRPSSVASSSSFDLYQAVTDQIVAMLDVGTAPWRSPILGRSSAGHPLNHESGRRYRGVNVFLLAMTAWAKGYESARWVTFNQAKACGGSVRKGEKSSLVVFWKLYPTKDKQTGKDVTVPVLRYFNVFNLAQCEGIAAPDAPAWTPSDYQANEAAGVIVQGYAAEGGPIVEHGGSEAHYRPSSDTVRLPEPTRFVTTDDYYATLFHEVAHSTGHASRLDRDGIASVRPFGSPDYSREELVAEMAAAFLCGEVGIAPGVIENQAAYLQGWIDVLKGDKRLVIAAAGAAQRAADWVLGVRPAGSPSGDAADDEADPTATAPTVSTPPTVTPLVEPPSSTAAAFAGESFALPA